MASRPALVFICGMCGGRRRQLVWVYSGLSSVVGIGGPVPDVAQQVDALAKARQ